MRFSHSILSIAVWAAIIMDPHAALQAADSDDAKYADLVERAKKGDGSVDFRAMRLACLQAKKCDARGEREAASSLRQAMQAKDYKKAAGFAETLIDQGFVNIEAHAIASQAYEGLNDPKNAQFHHEITASLLRSIFATGDGKSKETAFEVIGTFEEYIVVSVLGLPRPTSQSLIVERSHSFDVLETTDPKTRATVSVFFNIDAFYPMKGL